MSIEDILEIPFQSTDGNKDILKIKSTGELCVDEGHDIKFSPGVIQPSKHIRVIDPENHRLTNDTRDVDPSDLFTYLVWNGSEYISS
ncbi:MAG: hypothetical protein RLZZ184_4155 [Cyanobacteriota bacterium]